MGDLGALLQAGRLSIDQYWPAGVLCISSTTVIKWTNCLSLASTAPLVGPVAGAVLLQFLPGSMQPTPKVRTRLIFLGLGGE